jgi:outer membrane protein assembly factor BamB
MNWRAIFFAGVVLGLAHASAFAVETGDKAARTNLAQQYWPQWRGPMETGAAPLGNPPTEWSEEKNVKWKIRVPGQGSATPIIWGNQVFVQTAIPTGKKPDAATLEAIEAEKKADAEKAAQANDKKGGKGGKGMPRGEKPTEFYQFVLYCYDRATGKELWHKLCREEVPHEGIYVGEGSFAAASPVTDGKHVYAFFGSRGLYCFDMAGNLKWEKDFGNMKIKLGFGEGSSPALHGNMLVVNWDHEGGDSFVAALDATTGEQLWRTEREEATSWTTPLFVEYDGKLQVIVAATSKVRSYDPANGKLIWECSGLTPNSISSPVYENGVVYVTTGFRGSILLAIKLGQTGDLTGTDSVAWKFEKDTPYTPSPLLYDSRLYFSKGNDAIFSCLNASDGSVVYGPKRLEGLQQIYASPVAAAGRIYVVGRNGGAVVLREGDTFDVLATNKLDDGFDSSPAIVGNELFLRGKEWLYCIAEK